MSWETLKIGYYCAERQSTVLTEHSVCKGEAKLASSATKCRLAPDNISIRTTSYQQKFGTAPTIRPHKGFYHFVNFLKRSNYGRHPNAAK